MGEVQVWKTEGEFQSWFVFSFFLRKKVFKDKSWKYMVLKVGLVLVLLVLPLTGTDFFQQGIRRVGDLAQEEHRYADTENANSG